MKLLIFSLLFMTQAFAQTVDQQVEGIAKLKGSLESIIDQAPYQADQHIAIENYFKNLSALALEVKDFPKSRNRFNSLVARTGLDSFCSKVFVDQRRWLDLETNCTKNGFFLCAEEVRSFSASKNLLKDQLGKDLKIKFEATDSCK